MKLLLIQPSHLLNGGQVYKPRWPWLPGLTMPTIAALTPPDVEVTIVDEYVQEIDFNAPVDLVGLTAVITQSTRAYQIAGQFRRRGVPVVMGGHHASTLPEEALQHCDAVVIGEAEGIWPTVIEDAQRGNLQPRYRMNGYPSLEGLPRPRLSLLPMHRYLTSFFPVQTTRGCPFHCDFCAVTSFFGGTYRFRPVEEVVEEVKAIGSRNIFFVDDSIAANRSRAKELFQALIPLRLRWLSQANLTIANDPELLDLAEKSGCFALFIGLESLSEANLKQAGKTFNRPAEYPEAIRRIQKAGIHVWASFIFGLDDDDEAVFERTVRFLEENRLPMASFFTYVPLPGTRAAQRMEEEGRIIERDWAKYDDAHALFIPRRMSPQALEEGLWWAYRRFYSLPTLLRRAFCPPQHHLPLVLLMNFLYHSAVRRGIHPMSG
ncbi:MAG: radical SAM protein [Anaerolineae bacterium]